MKTISELVCEWCQENNVSPTKDDGRIIFNVEGSNGNFPSVIVPLEQERAIVYFCPLMVFANKEKLSYVKNSLIELNYSLKFGALQIDEGTGEITLRTSQFLPNDEKEAKNIIFKTVSSIGFIMDSLLRKLTEICL